MWRTNKKLLGIVGGLYLVLLIWNIMNISTSSTVNRNERNVLAEEEKINAVIHTAEEELPPQFIFADEAVLHQKRNLQKLDEELGNRFNASVFKLPTDFKPGANQSAKVFFNEKSDEIKSALIKRSNISGFTLNVPLQFGDADENTIHTSATNLYLMNRIINEAIEKGLTSLDEVNIKPVETEYSQKDGFEFEIHTSRFSFTGKPGKIFSFIDGFQEEYDDVLKQKVFLKNITIKTKDKIYSLEADFQLVSFKGEVTAETRKKLEMKKNKDNSKSKSNKKGKSKNPRGVPLGI